MIEEDSRFTMPWPPSTNDYWRSLVAQNGRVLSPADMAKRGLTVRVVRSADANKYRRSADAAIADLVRISGPVSTTGVFYFDREAGDLDNRVKQWLDGMKSTKPKPEKGRAGRVGAFGDDSRVRALFLLRALDRKNPRVETIIRPWVEPGEGLFVRPCCPTCQREL